MKLLLFAVRDLKAEYFNRPMSMRTVGEALRAFQDECRSPDSALSAHPEDYVLYQVGEYDQVTGKIVPMEPFSLGNGLQFPQVLGPLGEVGE